MRKDLQPKPLVFTNENTFRYCLTKEKFLHVKDGDIDFLNFKYRKRWRDLLREKQYVIFYRNFRKIHPLMFYIHSVTRRKAGLCLKLGKRITYSDSPSFQFSFDGATMAPP